MGEFKRKVGDPLNLKFKLSPSGLGTGLFARAFLTDRDGGAIAVLDLDEIAPGIYSNNSFVMPNAIQVVARLQAFNDAGFTQEAFDFPDTMDIFDRDDLDPSSLIKPPAQIFASITQDKVKGIVDGGEIKAQTQGEQNIESKIFNDEIKAQVLDGGKIKGVVDDN